MSLSNTGYAIAFIASLAPGLNSLPAIIKASELILFPVVEDVSANQISSSNDEVTYKIIADKTRNCLFLSAQGYSVQDGILMKSQLSFLNDPSPNASRPTGKQSMGLWRFNINNQPNATETIAVVEHDCGFWNVRTQLGPWPIERG